MQYVCNEISIPTLRSLKSTLTCLRQFLATESLLKLMRNAVYFTLKALLFLKIFKFLSSFFGHIKSSLIRKIVLISKFMTSQPGKQTILIHTLSNISRSKDNHRMKFGQLIEQNMRNIFLENSYKKWDRETVSRPRRK